MSQFTKGDLEMIHVGQTALRAHGLSAMVTVLMAIYLHKGLAEAEAKFLSVQASHPDLPGADGVPAPRLSEND